MMELFEASAWMRLESIKILAVHPAGGHALADDPFKEVFKGGRTPAASGFAQDAMIWNVVIETETDEPEPVEPLREGGHEFPLGADIVKD